MKKLTAMLVMVCMMLGASFAFADGSISADIKNTINTTGGSADQDQNQGQEQAQVQAQDQRQIMTTPRQHVNSLPGITGTLLTVAPIMADGRWHVRLCEEYTVEELKIMKDSSSYYNREGFFLVNLFTSPIERTVRVKKFSGKVSDSSVVRLVPDHPSNKVVAEYEGSGAKGVPLSAMIAYAGLEGVSDTGELSLVVEYRARDIATLSGVGVGSGAAAAVSSADSARSAGMSVGAIVGFSEAYTKYVYDIRVKVVRASSEALAMARCALPAEVPIAKPEPAPAAKSEPAPVVKTQPIQKAECNTDEIWKRINELKQEVQKCTRYCYNNLTLRSALGEAYIELYVCTGDARFLKDAIYHFEVAERNFRLGHDIRAHQGEATQVLNQVYYNWGGCMWVTQGQEAALKFKAAKRLERIPTGFTR